MKTTLNKIILGMALWLVLALPVYADIAVIVRTDSHVPYDDLLVEKIFLVQTLTLPDGTKRILDVDQSPEYATEGAPPIDSPDRRACLPLGFSVTSST